MTGQQNCGWETGTVYTGARTCGKPAKGRVVNGARVTHTGFVCGLHWNSASSRGYDVEALGQVATVGTVWRSLDKREQRHVRVVTNDGHFAWTLRCSPDGQVHGKPRRSRVRLAIDGSLPGFRLERDA